MRLDATAFAYNCTTLNFSERSYKGFVANGTSIQIAWFNDGDTLAEGYVGN
jgi:hypothetical protein